MKGQTTIQTIANNIKNDKGEIIMEERTIETGTPECLLCETMEELISVLGDDAEKIILSKTQAQLTIDFRGGVRNRLAAVDKETGALTYTDDKIVAFAEEWTPSLRVAKTKEEKALEILNGLDPDQLAKVLAQASAAS